MGKQSEKGNVIELVIIGVLVLGIAGLLVWRFMGNDSKSSNSASTTQAAQAEQSSSTASDSSSTTSQSSTSSSQQTDSNKGYIVIEDWGVRFKPAGSTAYTYAKVTGASEDTYGFSTSVLESMGKYCKASEGRKGSITRRTSTDTSGYIGNPGTLLNSGNKINGYYYYYSGPQSAGCTDSEPSSQDVNVEVAQVDLIKTLIFTIEAKQ